MVLVAQSSMEKVRDYKAYLTTPPIFAKCAENTRGRVIKLQARTPASMLDMCSLDHSGNGVPGHLKDSKTFLVLSEPTNSGIPVSSAGTLSHFSSSSPPPENVFVIPESSTSGSRWLSLIFCFLVWLLSFSFNSHVLW